MSRQNLAQDGKVVTFPSSSGRGRRPAVRMEGESGIVLLFTGIRYERPATSGAVQADRRAHAEA